MHCPVSETERHDPPGLIDQAVPGEAAVVDDINQSRFGNPSRQSPSTHVGITGKAARYRGSWLNLRRGPQSPLIQHRLPQWPLDRQAR